MYGLAARAVRISRRRADLSLPAAAGGDVPRRQPLTAQDVAFSLQSAEGEGPSDHPPAAARLRRRRGGRRRDRGRALRAEARPRRAAVRGAAADLLARLLRRPGRSTSRRSTCRSARAPTRSAASRPAATSNTSASRTGGAPTCRSRAGCNNFDVLRLRILSRPRRRLRGLHRQELSVPRGVHLAHLGDALRLSRRSATAGSSATMLPDDTPSGAQGWFINTRRDKFKDPRLREALIYAFDFEWTNKNIMYGSYERTHSVFQNSDMMADGQAGRGGAGAARAVPRQGARRGVRRAVRAAGLRRLGPGPRAAAQGRAACCRRPAIVHQGRQAGDAEGRAHHHRVPARRAVVPAAPHAVHQEPRHARHRCDVAHGRSGAVPRARRRLRLRHRDPAASSSRRTPGDGCAPISRRRRRRSRARRISPASPIRRSMR